ncbi:hypothetical protein [Moraxella bovoculi]|uniref:hypothetical protein n=1 Tax=Moraxella bovoculi TaxID=386891 RepID=UPI000ADD4005|nr:hypothetical protein [Moraxella bovoculi]
MIIRRDTLQQRSATLGNALAGELGIHSNPFGGGASKPIIRGQDGGASKDSTKWHGRH